jgi:hypothetical protein
MSIGKVLLCVLVILALGVTAFVFFNPSGRAIARLSSLCKAQSANTHEYSECVHAGRLAIETQLQSCKNIPSKDQRVQCVNQAFESYVNAMESRQK